MSSDTNVWKRLFNLRATIDKMIVDGSRTPERVADALQEIVDQAKVYLHRLYETETIAVRATDGTETMSRLSASGHGTEAATVIVDEQVANGTFADLFGSKGPNRRRWSRSQVARFSRDNPDRLRGSGYGNLFELEDGSVANVYVTVDGQPHADVFRFAYVDVWFAEYRHRFFSLQQ